jgi:hypothetical protein
MWLSRVAPGRDQSQGSSVRLVWYFVALRGDHLGNHFGMSQPAVVSGPEWPWRINQALVSLFATTWNSIR